MNHRSGSPVLILGAGINGCAVARDLVLNGVSVLLVDRFDISSGTTAKSSRLIHGGLRYLEYAELDLVKESLAERQRLLHLAPQFVRPLRLYIPVPDRLGGLVATARRFLGRPRAGGGARGLYLVRAGLTLYNWFARDRSLPGPTVHTLSSPGLPRLDPARCRWLCAYTDAQILHPERFVLALVEDARRAAAAGGGSFELYTYHQIRRHGRQYEVQSAAGTTSTIVEPAAVVNATGPWGDDALERLQIAAPRRIGGTKGSHVLTFHPGLVQALGRQGVYAEAPDGRLVFVLPLPPGVLIGTTDEPFDGPPETAVASRAEVDYLLGMVNALFADVRLTTGDVALHQCGVRPLPFVRDQAPAAITRRHLFVEDAVDGHTVLTLIGGKLTTCRSFAEAVTNRVLGLLGRPRRATTADRLLPGAEGFPVNADQERVVQDELSQRYHLPPEQVQAVWKLVGARADEILAASPPDGRVVADTKLPIAFVRWVIDHEYVTEVLDLVERRLCLLYESGWSRRTLRHLAELLSGADGMPSARAAAEQLAARYGTELPESSGDAGAGCW